MTRASIAALTLAATITAAAESQEPALSIDSSTPTVTTDVLYGTQSTIRLPSLQYDFTIGASCGKGALPRSVSISVADTLKRLAEDKLQSGDLLTVTMTIPARQIAPLTFEGFCAGDQPQDAPPAASLTVHGALSLQASLICADETEQNISYVSKGLDVMLSCSTAQTGATADSRQSAPSLPQPAH